MTISRMIQRAVWLYVIQPYAQLIRCTRQPGDLIAQRSFEFVDGDCELLAAKVCWIRVTWVRARGDSQFFGKLKRPLHRRRIARVASARDICGGNMPHQLEIRPICERFGIFTQVRIDIDRRCFHRSFLCIDLANTEKSASAIPPAPATNGSLREWRPR